MSRLILPDQTDRDAITGALDDTLVVEAAAGTGKTTELVSRIVRILASGCAKVENIVAVTFTEKAAGELKLRLREALDEARGEASGDEREALNKALQSLEEAHVSTIHGFCAELLRERPVEARVDPLFRVLTEPQAARLFEHAFTGWIQGQLEQPAEGIRRALRRSVWQGFGDTPREDTPIDRLRRAAWDLAEWRDFTAPWTRREFHRDPAVDDLVDELHAFAALSDAPSYAKDSLFLDTAPARHLASEIAIQQEAGSADYDGCEARFVDLSRDRAFSRVRHGRGPGYKAGVPRQRVVDAYESLRGKLDQFRLDADAQLAALLQQELSGAIKEYEDLKARSGALDFLDLLLKARDLVRGNASVRAGFQKRFTRIFVDEFQDTDPLQAEILLLLAAADPDATNWRTVTPVPGRLFIVGDPKQSIYRFRRADVAIYREVCERLIAAGARHVRLSTSFRGVPGIQALVNAAFAPVMNGDRATLQADYVPLKAYRPAIKGQPSVVVLPVPEPYGTRNVSAVRIEQSLPDAVGGYIEWLISDSGWKVDGGRPVQARDICILFRRFLSFGEDMTQPYVRALEARGLHHVLVGGRTFHNREEVETLRAALAAVEWPDDELSVFAALRGALFAIGDEELLEWKQRFGGFHPFRIPDVNSQLPTPNSQLPTPNSQSPALDHLRPIADALHVLQRMHRRRNYRPIAETVQDLVAQTRAHVGIVLRTAGEQALANVLHIAQLAREYEANGGLSFRGFVDELTVAADAADAAEAPILEEGSDGVRLMTVHKAKGLEFPVVVLADLTCKLSRSDAGRWLDPENSRCALRLGGWSPIDLVLHGNDEVARDRSEAQRLAYVAATRARDLLVVPAIGDGPYEGGWLDALTPVIYPSESARRSPQSAPGVPLFKSKDTVLNRPDGDPARPHTVAPGTYALSTHHLAPSTEHRAPGTAPTVTWWDPRALHLGASAPFGLRRDDLIVKTGDLFGVDERLAEYERWRDARAAIVATAQQPAVRVQTASAWAAETAKTGVDTILAESADITVVALPGNADRPHGPRFGTLVHAVLATLPLDADRGLVERGARVQSRILNAPADELRAAIDVVVTVLGHELLGRARAASSVKRETPVSWVLEDGTLIEGVLDLAFDEGDTTMVVDFKTDYELAAGETRYRAQLQQYLGAVSRATGRRARGVLFRV